MQERLIVLCSILDYNYLEELSRQGRDDMLGIERRQKIMNILQQNKKAYVAQLAQEFGITEETVRRDLEKLEKQNLLQRTYGGAVLLEKANEDLSFEQRSITHVAEKRKISEMAIQLIDDGDTVFMDSSSTALMLRPHLERKKNITIITNSIRLLYDAALNTNLHIISTGGRLKENSFALIGPTALDTIDKFSVDLAIISSKALNKQHGFMESTEEEAMIKQHMLHRAKKKLLLADHHKFDKIAFTRIGYLDEIQCLITDRRPSEEWCRLLLEKDIQLINE